MAHAASGARSNNGGATVEVKGWGGAVSAPATVVVAASAADVRSAFALATRQGRPLVLRGGGCSYGDASLVNGGILVDLAPMNAIQAFDRTTGLVTVEPGVTVKQLIEHVLPHGWWLPVVPGTMVPTLGGCVAMNIHGKNSFRVGTIGGHVRAFDLVLPTGEAVTCSPTENANLFTAAIGGFGMFGCMTSITLQLKHVSGGRLRVSAFAPRSLAAMISCFENEAPGADYLVGWINGFARGARLGSGIVHRGDHVGSDVDPQAGATLAVEAQRLPSRLLGLIPSTWMWRLTQPLVNDLGMRCVNAAKEFTGGLEARRAPHFQTHVRFSFLLDWIPDWKLAYGRGGMIQYQSFVPAAEAARVHGALIARAQERGIVPYLLVYKRHRRDPWPLTHSVDGYSMAMDFRVTAGNRARLWDLCRSFDDDVAAGGGRFYFAKDATLTAAAVNRAFPAEEIAAFHALKRSVDPAGVLRSALYDRLFAPDAPK